MTKYLLPTLGLALLWGVASLGQAQAGEATCGVAGCETGCCNGGCQGACDCCPHCGCKLVPVCHPTCETKKETVHKYCCTCKDICIPGVTRIGQHSECGDNGGACGGGCSTGFAACDPCNKGCEDGCDCHCRVRTIHKLMVCPVPKEHCVRGCTVTWTCPKCGDCGACGNCQATPATTVAPTGPAPAAPAPAPSHRLPPPPKTTDGSTLPEDIRTAGAGY